MDCQGNLQSEKMINGGINYTSRLTQGFRYYKVTQGGLNNSYILSIAEDKDGNLWIGTDGGGLNVLISV